MASCSAPALAEQALAHFTLCNRRVRLNGPTVTIGPKAAMTLTLAFHELTTNAIKYGALSNASGVIELTWKHRRQPVAACRGGTRGQRRSLAWAAGRLPASSRQRWPHAGQSPAITSPIEAIWPRRRRRLGGAPAEQSAAATARRQARRVLGRRHAAAGYVLDADRLQRCLRRLAASPDVPILIAPAPATCRIVPCRPMLLSASSASARCFHAPA